MKADKHRPSQTDEIGLLVHTATKSSAQKTANLERRTNSVRFGAARALSGSPLAYPKIGERSPLVFRNGIRVAAS
jgi:hypothetical protein